MPGSAQDHDLTILENFRLVGTVNMDETTYAISPKVVDRSCVLRFKNPIISEEILTTLHASSIDPLRREDSGDFHDILQWITRPLPSGLNEGTVNQLMEEVDHVNRSFLKHLGSDVPYSYRTRSQLETLARRLLWLGADEEEALDAMLRLKILPRLRFYDNSDEVRDRFESLRDHLSSRAPGAHEIVERVQAGASKSSGDYNFWMY